MSRLERELAELGGQLTETLEELGVPACLIDRDGVIKWQNAASREINGDVVGSMFTSIVAPNDRPDAREMLNRILCRGEPADFTIEVRAASGGYLSREISAAPVRDGESVVGIFGIGQPPSPTPHHTRGAR